MAAVAVQGFAVRAHAGLGLGIVAKGVRSKTRRRVGRDALVVERIRFRLVPRTIGKALIARSHAIVGNQCLDAVRSNNDLMRTVDVDSALCKSLSR